jgi:hypothetical protein
MDRRSRLFQTLKPTDIIIHQLQEGPAVALQ